MKCFTLVSGNDIDAAIEMRKASRSHPNTIKNFFLHIPNVLENKVKVKSKKKLFFVKKLKKVLSLHFVILSTVISTIDISSMVILCGKGEKCKV